MRTRAEVVIVILILLTCGAMFTVFVGKVREAAARSQCGNNLKQLGMALNSYHDSFNEYPRADMPNAELLPEKRLSWIVCIVPYIEANSIYYRMDKEKSWDAEENRFAAEFQFLTMRCPGRPVQQSDDPVVPTCYVGISGVGDNAIALPRDARHAGIFGYDRPVKLQELKRGGGETILLAETRRIQGAWTAAGTPTTRGLNPDGPLYCGREGQFGGNHRGGANVAFADGSVRRIAPSVVPSVWEAMATLRGDENPE